ncbi:MAG: hypothetical protein MN733_15225 [Nitrososphaera sp.]|nr:hypothetical protein [Nitrososphaera sp.]
MGLPRRSGWYIAAFVGAVVLVGIAAFGSGQAPESKLAPDEEALPVKEMFARGIYQHLVETRFDAERVELRRGQTVSVHFAVEHFSHVWWESANVKNFGNKLANYLPSGQEVPVNNYLRYSPDTMVLPSNSSNRASVTISLPQDLPDEMLDSTIKISASFEADYLIADKDNAARKPGVLLIRIIS